MRPELPLLLNMNAREKKTKKNPPQFPFYLIDFIFYNYSIVNSVEEISSVMWSFAYMKRWLRSWLSCSLLVVYLITCILLLHNILFHHTPAQQSISTTQTRDSSNVNRMIGAVAEHDRNTEVKYFCLLSLSY